MPNNAPLSVGRPLDLSAEASVACPKAEAASAPRGAADAPLELSVITTSEAFQALEEEWNELLRRIGDCHFFQEFAYVFRVWHYVAEPRGRRLFLVTGRQEGRLVVVWPLMIDKQTLRFIASDKCEYRDVLLEPNGKAWHWLAAAWRFIRSSPDFRYVLLQDVPESSPLTGLLGQPGRFAWRKSWAAKTIDLTAYEDWADYERVLPKKLRLDQRRQWKRIRKAADAVCFSTVAEGEERRAVAKWLHQHKIAWLKQRNLTHDDYADARFARFFEALATDRLDAGEAVVFKLSAKETIVAAAIGFRHGNDFTFWSFCYDPSWESYSPSRLLLEKIIDWCLTKGLHSFDLMPGKEEYKRKWSDREVCYHDYLLANGLFPRLCLAFWQDYGSPLMAKMSDSPLARRRPSWLGRGLRSRLPALDFGNEYQPLSR